MPAQRKRDRFVAEERQYKSAVNPSGTSVFLHFFLFKYSNNYAYDTLEVPQELWLNVALAIDHVLKGGGRYHEIPASMVGPTMYKKIRVTCSKPTITIRDAMGQAVVVAPRMAYMIRQTLLDHCLKEAPRGEQPPS